MKKFDIPVPEGESGNFKVEYFEVSEEDAKLFNIRAMMSAGGRGIEAGRYVKLKRGNTMVMSNTPAEIADHREFFFQAKGNILINGLGLGVCIFYLLQNKSEEITSITVIEKEPDVINLISPYIKDDRVDIICADAFEYQPPKGKRYDCVWHDIWDAICSDNLPDMHRLHRKYGRKADWQGSWCRWLCEMNR